MTLRTATLALVYSVVEYCAPDLFHSFHTCLIYPIINEAVQFVTGCLRPTPKKYLLVLAGIPPAKLRRRKATLSLACRAMEPSHLLFLKITAA